MTRRAICDLSNILWNGLMSGKDQEYGRVFQSEKGKDVWVNGAQHGVFEANSFMLEVLKDLNIQPRDCIFVIEGEGSKSLRQYIDPNYKAGKDKLPAQYERFNEMKAAFLADWLKVGAQACTQKYLESDDTMAYLAKHLKGERWIISGDKDLSVLVGGDVHQYRRGAIDQNPFGPFDHKYGTVYIALVGDTADGIKGAPGFGDGAFLKMLGHFGEECLPLMENLIVNRKLHALAEDVAEFKPLQKIIDGAQSVYASYDMARLYPEKVNTMRCPLTWSVGMVSPRREIVDERLRVFGSVTHLITADKYADAVEFMRSKVKETPEFCLDLETSVPEESFEWLERRTKTGGGVDVLGSEITGCGLTFGLNGQYGFYFSVDHAETNNIKLDDLRTALEVIPQSTVTVAQNCAGFELPVLHNAFGEAWKDNGWRGFFPNMVDSRIAASYWNENAPSHGLKQLSKSILGYEQETYAEVTQKTGVLGTSPKGGRVLKEWSKVRSEVRTVEVMDPEVEGYVTVDKEFPILDEDGNEVVEVWQTREYQMNELSGKHVLSYGIDDVFCTQAIYNHFKTIMELEDTYEAFMKYEQKPVYLSAMSYVNGTNISLQRLMELKAEDDKIYEACERDLHEFLIQKGWDGTVCPVYTELDAAKVKEIYLIATGEELKTMVRTVSKLAYLIREAGHEVLAEIIEKVDLESINKLVADRFDGTPIFDVASPKQVGRLLYEVMGLPIRLRNKPTDVMRSKGIKEGTARTDDDSIKMAQKMGDVAKDSLEYKVLSALMAMKSINTKRGLYYEPYPNAIHWKDGRLHPELVQCSTNTRRWSSRSPNIQQLDSEYNGIRSVILPHHRNAVVVSLDESSQEVRLAASYSQDENLKTCYVGSKDQLRDVHSIVASKIAGVSYDEFVKTRKSPDPAVSGPADKIRGIAKVVLFASFYGAMAPKIAESLGISVEEAQEYIDTIYSQFSGLAKWKEQVEQLAESNGYVRILGGTVRHLRDNLLSENGYERSKALRQASNAMIQSAGATQIKVVMSKIWDSNAFEKYDLEWLFPCHDEVVFSVHRDQAAEVIKEFHGYMVAQFLDGVPSASSIGLGKTFGSLNELGEEYDADKIEAALAEMFEEKLAA